MIHKHETVETVSMLAGRQTIRIDRKWSFLGIPFYSSSTLKILV